MASATRGLGRFVFYTSRRSPRWVLMRYHAQPGLTGPGSRGRMCYIAPKARDIFTPLSSSHSFSLSLYLSDRFCFSLFFPSTSFRAFPTNGFKHLCVIRKASASLSGPRPFIMHVWLDTWSTCRFLSVRQIVAK